MAENDSVTGHGDGFSLQSTPTVSNMNIFTTVFLFLNVGSSKRHRMKAIQTSKHCNIICMYTAFTTTDSLPNKSLSESMDVHKPGGPPDTFKQFYPERELFFILDQPPLKYC